MAITVEVANFAVKKTLVDQGSSTDILYYSTFQKLGILEGSVQPYNNKLTGFYGELVDTRGYVDLLTTFGSGGLS